MAETTKRPRRKMPPKTFATVDEPVSPARNPVQTPKIPVAEAVAAWVVRQIGEQGEKDLQRSRQRLIKYLVWSLDPEDLGGPGWGFAGALGLRARTALVAEIVELADAAFVAGHRSATGHGAADRQTTKRAASAVFNAELIKKEYAKTAGRGLKQGQRIAMVREATGASRSAVYRALNLGR